ncbi:hypothetical protein GCM10022197_14820 [Microlunatus spumicola]|uniref:Uncharacterized protein n=1 Tax=Microlunatus spumicola TaxID=81499 RepID=A0ABP6X4U7_9ACTN
MTGDRGPAGGSADGVRPEVRRLASWAPLPSEDDELWQEDVIDRFAADVAAVAPPLSVPERDALLALLGRPDDDTVYGVLWGVLHLVETAPDDGYEHRLETSGHPWFATLLDRRANADRRGRPAD